MSLVFHLHLLKLLGGTTSSESLMLCCRVHEPLIMDPDVALGLGT